ncbi:MAG: TIGR00341 family protein [Methanoregulaceae archaeon]|nr:TIGR00341 family protein [Methanoregulaceae archaeon]
MTRSFRLAARVSYSGELMVNESSLSVAEERSEHQAKVRKSIASNAWLSGHFLVMNALATIVAAYGLLANSTAVVIGAMIIAMLLGPIMGLALAIVDGNTRLLRRAIEAEIVGAAMVVGIGLVVGRIHPDIAIASEILSRTKPNLLDLVIALAGGAAGAYATVSPRVSVGLVGVAISTALVPPLASSGICLSRGLLPQAGGAFLLFFTNLVAIQCASSAVLYAFGFHNITRRQKDDRVYLRTLAIDGGILLGLTIFLYFQLSSTLEQQQFESSVSQRLRMGLERIPGAFLAESRFVKSYDADIVIAVVRVPNSITPEQVSQLQARLEPRRGKKIELHVRSLLTKEATAEGYLHVIEPDALPVDDVKSTPNVPQVDPEIVTPSIDLTSPESTDHRSNGESTEPATRTGGTP